jgi:hypothetical protein
MVKNDKNASQHIQAIKHVVAIAASAISLVASMAYAAEPPKDLQPLEDIPPPAMSKEGEGLDEPEVTIIKRGEDTVEEYRINGQLYMMKVTPKSGKAYYLHKEDQDGGWINDGPNKPLIIPKWTIFRF